MGGAYAGGVGGGEEVSADVVLADVVHVVSPQLVAQHCVAGAHEADTDFTDRAAIRMETHEVDRAAIRRVSTLAVQEHVGEQEGFESRVRVTERQTLHA